MFGRNYCMEKRDKRKQLLKILFGICIFYFIGISVIKLIDFKQKIVEDSIEFHQNAQRIAKQNESDIIDCIKNDDKENKIKRLRQVSMTQCLVSMFHVMSTEISL